MIKSIQVGVNFTEHISNSIDGETNSSWKLHDPHDIDASFINPECFDVMETFQNHLWMSQQML